MIYLSGKYKWIKSTITSPSSWSSFKFLAGILRYDGTSEDDRPAHLFFLFAVMGRWVIIIGMHHENSRKRGTRCTSNICIYMHLIRILQMIDRSWSIKRRIRSKERRINHRHMEEHVHDVKGGRNLQQQRRLLSCVPFRATEQDVAKKKTALMCASLAWSRHHQCQASCCINTSV